MNILVAKISSMGDVLHLMPALSDLAENVPGARVDWMVEDSFAEIPAWHGIVDRVIPVSTRRWRRINQENLREFRNFLRTIRLRRYDAVVDAQGLMKSAMLARFARLAQGGRRIGFSADSIKEKAAAKMYREKISIPRDMHAIGRLRQLFAIGFDYRFDADSINYCLNLEAPRFDPNYPGTVLFFPGTTWQSKHLPDVYWRQLADLATADGYRVKISWGNEKEKARAEWIARSRPEVEVLAKSTLNELAQVMLSSSGVIAVDTGLVHMAASLSVPAVSVYGSTDAKLTGAVGNNQQHIQAQYNCSPCFLKRCDKLTKEVLDPPCYQTVRVAQIWGTLNRLIA